MITITQQKIAGLSPRWALFPGFSVLFDAPSAEYRREGEIEILAGDVEGEACPDLYRRAYEGLGLMSPDVLLRTYGFCPLPPPSYHVTAFDVANVADLDRCRAEERDGLRATLNRLPASDAFEAELLRAAAEGLPMPAPLTFGFGELCHWGGVLALRLAPSDEAAFEDFVVRRAALSHAYLERFGVGAKASFTPHLSLGYFMNAEGAELARPRLGEWNEAMAAAIGDATATFERASLHGFTDMATFFRVATS